MAYKHADSLRSLYILSCEPCHLVDNCSQYQCNAPYMARLLHIMCLLDILLRVADPVSTSAANTTY